MKHNRAIALRRVVMTAGVASLITYTITASVLYERTTPIEVIPHVEANVDAAVAGAMQSKIRQLQDDVLAQLAQCESGQVKEPDAAIIFDGGKYDKMMDYPSIGRYQFKVKTVQFYTKKFENREISRAEAVKIAVDKDAATELARKVVFETESFGKEWVNCSKKNGLAGQVTLIKKLTQ